MRFDQTDKNGKGVTISKASDAIHRRHLDHECEEIIDERIQRFVRHHAPRQMRDRLEFVIDEQLRSHHDET